MINQIAPLPLRWNWEHAKATLHSASTITLITASALGSIALAYYKPDTWYNVTLAAGVINLYAITKVMRYGNSRMIRTVLGINLAALGALSLGGFLAPHEWLKKIMYYSNNPLDPINLTTKKLLVYTFLAGYGVPLLKLSYSILNDPNWKRRSELLENFFTQTPEVGFGLLQTALLENAKILLFLIGSHFTKEKLNSIIEKFEDLQLNPNGHALSVLENKDYFYLQLQFSCDFLNSAEADQAANILLEKSQLLLSCLTKEQYSDLFLGSLLRQCNHKIDNFLNGMAAMPNLQNRLTELENGLNEIEVQLEREPTDELKRQLKQLNYDFNELRIRGEGLYTERQRWHQFFRIWGDERLELQQRFSQIERLKREMGDPTAGDALNLFYRKLVNLEVMQGIQPFPSRIQSALIRFHLEEQGPVRIAGIQLRDSAKKISQTIYRLCSMGLIVVPILIQPPLAAVGFGFGVAYFLLVRFGFTPIHGTPFSDIFRMCKLDIALDRKFFSLTEETRQRMEQFSEANLLEKIRLLNLDILVTFGMIVYPMAQGVLLAKEISELFPNRT
ncbi:MAG: hypothetical protein H0V82_05830 [Candidatus Protochlamydia sp.]|nr:hypothetical protein [Candidatus Protochlamydia sp.]